MLPEAGNVMRLLLLSICDLSRRGHAWGPQSPHSDSAVHVSRHENNPRDSCKR